MPPLRNAVRDALEVGRVLGVHHGFSVQGLFDAAVTATSLRALVAETLPAQIGPDDRLVVYLAGHGLTIPSSDGPNGYLLFHDADRDSPETFVPMRELHDRLTALRCRHLLLVLDCCFAGTFRWAARRDVIVRKQVFRETFDRYVESPAWQVMTSAASDQKALDVFGERTGARAHSPFASALIEGLTGAADLDGDGLLTATELYLHARNRVELATDGGVLQSPGLFPLPRRHERGEFVFQVPDRRLELPAAPELTPELNPYRGLESFDEGSRELFFGRERDLRQLARTVLTRSLTVVVGPSGCGKSSLVKAGLVPMFRAREAATGPRRWSIVGPVRALDAVLARLTEGDLPDGNVLVVIDQLEDLLTQAVTEEQRTALLASLARWSALDRVRLVVTARSDYEPQLQHGSWSTAWRAGRFVVPPMSQDQLRRAIEEPAAAREIYFKPARIVDDLINEVVQMPGALPLLAFTLSELYRCYFARRSEERAITEEDLDTVGGVTRALTLRATSLVDELSRLDPAFTTTAGRVMLRMIATAGPEPARRRVPLSELVYDEDRETARAKQLIDRFVAARLLVMGSEPDGQAYVEPAHDGLIRGWDRLAEWRARGEDHFALVRALGAAASTWSHGRDSRFLWHVDPRLPQLVALERSASHPLNRLELEFVALSARRRRRRIASLATTVAAVIAALALIALIALRARDEATEQSEQAQRQRANALVSLAPTLTDPLQGALVLAEIQDESPTGWQAAMVARRMAIQTIPLSVQRPSSNEIQQLSLHPSGQHVLARDAAGDAWLLSLDGRREPLSLRSSAPVIDARFAHGGGSSVLAVFRDGSAAIWSIDRRAASSELQGNGRPAVAFGLSAERAAIGHDDGTVRVFQLDATGRVVSSFDHKLPSHERGRLLISEDARRAISIAPEAAGRRLLVSTIALSPGAQAANLGFVDLESSPYTRDVVIPKAFLSADGARLAVYTGGHTLRTWELDSMHLVLTGDREFRFPAVSDGDARCFAMASPRGEARVWGRCGEHELTRSKQPPQEEPEGADTMALSGPAPFAFGVHREAGTTYALVGAGDGSALLWSLKRREATFLRRFLRHGAGVSALAIRPELETIATASRDGEIRVWSMADPLVIDGFGPSYFTDGQHAVQSTMLGSNFHTIGDDSEPAQLPESEGKQARGAWFGDTHVIVWYDDERICSYRSRPLALERCCEIGELPTAATRSSDGARLWIGHEDGAAATCDLATGKTVRLLASAGEPTIHGEPEGGAGPDLEPDLEALAARQRRRVIGFAPDARGIVVVHLDGSLAHVGADAAISLLPTHGATIAAVGRDGAMIATVSAAGNVQVHRAADGWEAHQLGHHLGEVSDLAITPDGRGVLSCTAGTVCSLWTADARDRKQMFWPRGRFVGMSSAGDLVITAEGASFLVWSPAQPGLPIDLGREDLPGFAVSAHLSPGGKHLVSIWADAQIVLGDHMIPVQRFAIWRMDWREIVRDLRSSTTACLSPEQRSALLDDGADEARAAHERCMRRYQRGLWPVQLTRPPVVPDRVAAVDRPISPIPRVSLASGHVTRVTVHGSPMDLFGDPARKKRHADQVQQLWSALAEEVRRIGGARLDREELDRVGTSAMFWTPVPLDVGRGEHYEHLVDSVRAESVPWDSPRNRILVECRSRDGKDHVALLSTPLAFGDVFDLGAARAGRPGVPANELLDLVSFACVQVSTVFPRPLSVSRIEPWDSMPLPAGIMDMVQGSRGRRTDPAVLAGRIARVAGPSDEVTDGRFAELFGHPPETPTSDD